MVEMVWHRRETRRQTEKTNINCISEETALLDSINSSPWGGGREMAVPRKPFAIVSYVRTDLSATPIQSIPPSSHPSTGKPKLLDQMREALRSRHYSLRTEQTYCHWAKRFIFFHNVRHPADMAEPEINTHVLNRGPSGVRSPVDGL